MARLISILGAVLVFCVASSARAQSSTHSWLFPTGDTVPAGDVHWSGHQLYLYDTIAWGVNDRLELSISAPVVPFFVHAHARVGLTERSSPFKLVGGIGAIVIMDPDDDDAGTFWVLSATAAYQTGGLNLHATLSAVKDRDEALGFGVLTAGVRMRINDKTSLIADFGRFSSRDGDDFDVASAFTIGLKHASENLEVDFGFAFVPDADMPPLPMLSTTHKF